MKLKSIITATSMIIGFTFIASTSAQSASDCENTCERRFQAAMKACDQYNPTQGCGMEAGTRLERCMVSCASRG